MRYIEGINRKRKIAYPDYIDEYITEDNPVRVMEAFINSLDMIALGFEKAIPADTGRLGFNPKDLLKLYLYGYMNKITSSRKLEAEAIRNIEVMWLLRKLRPDFKTIADFRKDNKAAIQKVFKQFVALCKQWDLFGMEVVAVDGSKFRASNSKKNNFNQKSLSRKIKYLEEKIQEYMTKIDENDIVEESSRQPDTEEIKRRIKELENRKEKYENLRQDLDQNDINEISTTDPDARLMTVNNNGIDVCYNVQTVVDSKHKLIVDCDVINNPTDHGQLSEMGLRAKKVFEVDSLNVLADKGYYNVEDLIVCDKEGLITYVPKQTFSNATGEREFYSDKFKYDKERNIYTCPAGQELYCIRKKPIDENTKDLRYKNFKACKNCELKDKCTTSKKGRILKRPITQDFLDTVDQRTNENKELYRTRQMIVEHPFGTVKRGWGLSYFLMRGIKSVKTETSLAFLAYNMKRVINILGIKEIIKRLEGLLSSSNLYKLLIGKQWACWECKMLINGIYS